MSPTLITIIIACASLVIIPTVVAEVRYRMRCSTRLGKIESFVEFLQDYMLKSAVLEFHSPDPAHYKTDRIIEKLVGDQELAPEEIDSLVNRIATEAKHGDDQKQRLRATATLILLGEFMDAVLQKKSMNVLRDFE